MNAHDRLLTCLRNPSSTPAPSLPTDANADGNWGDMVAIRKPQVALYQLTLFAFSLAYG